MKKITIYPNSHERMVSKRETVIRTKFGLWLNQNMLRCGMRQVDVAKKLHVGRAHVAGHASGYHRPTFMNVVSYCWVFGGKDDPEEIWKLVNEEIES